MTIKDAIQGMLNFYRAVEKVEATKEVKTQLDDCLIEVSDAMSELEKMQTVGVNCRHCKFYNAPDCNACKECMFFWLTSSDQRKPLNYEPI